MPRGDRTGPMGYGPLTGRGAGYCAGYGVPGYGNFGGGWLGLGYGRGYGRGRGWWGVPPYPLYERSQANEAVAARELQRETDFLKDRVAEINDRLAEIATALNELGKTDGNGSKDESESK